MFSLDIFDGNYGFWGTILGLLVHNIPVFILAILLAISWKYEIVGAVTFFLSGLLYVALMLFNALENPVEFYMLSYSLIIAGPAFLIGALFLINWKNKLKSVRLK